MKLDNPPAAENWTRMQDPSVDRTTKNLFGFLKGRPQFTYEAFRRTSKYRIEDRISLEAALRINAGFGSHLGKAHNEEAIRAFFEFESKHPIEGLPVFDGVLEHYPLSRSSRIPVKPLAVVREESRFVPIFVIPWARWAFDDFQSSLYMTILERSIFTLTDFEDSNAKILFVPKIGLDKAAKRSAILWERGEVPLLSNSDFADQIRVYNEGKVNALKLYESYKKDQD